MNDVEVAFLVVGCIIGVACVLSTVLVVAILASNTRLHKRSVILVQRERNDTEKD